MFYFNSKIKILGLCTVVSLVTACTSTQPLNAKNQISNIQNNKTTPLKVTKINKSEISIVINQTKSLNTKAYSDAILPKTKFDVSIYKVFISKNKLNPFTTGDMITEIKTINVVADSTAPASVTFTGIPDGGPYYAFVSAYEKYITNFDGIPEENFINITRADNNLLSIDKKWATSSNNVNIVSVVNTFSDKSDALKVSLNLQDGVPSSVDTAVRLYTGAPVSGNPVIQ